MSDELDLRLKAPEPDPEVVEATWGKVRAEFERAAEEGARTGPTTRRWILAGTLAVFLIGCGMWIGQHLATLGSVGAAAPPDLVALVEQQRQLLSEIVKLFPEGLNGIVTRQGETRLQLAGRDAAASDQPVLIVIDQGGDRTLVVGFSGRLLELELNGRPESVEVLLTGDGDVVLVGESFVWTGSSGQALGNASVLAQALEG